MLSDERIIEIISQRAEEECGWSKASVVFNHESWVDVMTHLFLEKGLRGPLMDAYKDEIFAARVKEHFEEAREMAESAAQAEAYVEWTADVATRGEEKAADPRNFEYWERLM